MAPEARLTEAHLDGSDVGELLRAVGQDDPTPTAATLMTLPLRDGLPALRGLLTAVFESA